MEEGDDARVEDILENESELMHEACRQSSEEVVTMLLNKGAHLGMWNKVATTD